MLMSKLNLSGKYQSSGAMLLEEEDDEDGDDDDDDMPMLGQGALSIDTSQSSNALLRKRWLS